jgi:hypothetical protein
VGEPLKRSVMRLSVGHGSIQVSGENINEILTGWAKRHGLRISNTYRNQFYSVDIVDDAGGSYEISVVVDVQPGFHKVRASSNRRRNCGFVGVEPQDLDGMLERAYVKVIKWVDKTGGSKIFAA